MKKLLTIFCILILSACSNEVPYGKLVLREGIYYEVNSRTPFTGIAYDDFSSNPNMGYGETKFKNGLKHGDQTSYFPNGQLAMKKTWHNGCHVGALTYWYENGQKSAVYRNDDKCNRHGLTQQWDMDGNITEETCYIRNDRLSMYGDPVVIRYPIDQHEALKKQYCSDK
tara:strand:+ start:353 stop:859 length:507 start_codon:yes stop_codon:yes gene_type:complete